MAFKRGAEALLADCDSYDFTRPVATLRCMANTIRRGMGGSSGGFYDLALRAASNALAGAPTEPAAPPASVSAAVAALEAGVSAVKHYGNASAGDRTMLDAFIPAIEAMRGAPDGSGVKETLRLGAVQATSGAKATADMSALAGRSSYLSADQVSGVQDPGATAAAVWLNAAADSL